jgi:hypothetical protein
MLPTCINAGQAVLAGYRRPAGALVGPGFPSAAGALDGRGFRSAAGAAEGSQGQVRAQRARCPWITDKKRASPAGATDTLARFCRPSRPGLLFSNVPGASASAASTLPLDHRLKAREPRRGDRHSGPFLSAFQACPSFLKRSRGYALRARPWLPSAAPAALVTTICRACGALTTEL